MTLRLTGALLGGALLLTATAAFARDGDPVGGVGVGVETSPGGIIIATTTTNGTGEFSVASIPPGTYKVRITSGPDKGKVLKP